VAADADGYKPLNGFVAAATATNGYGIVAGEATRSAIDASGAAGVLDLKQGVFAQPTARVSGHSLALQSFYYAGPTETRTISNVFHFDANVAPTMCKAWASPSKPCRGPTIARRCRCFVTC